jgi:hypothetical protein
MPHIIKTLILLSAIFLTSCVFLTENSLNQSISDNSFLNRFPQNQKTIVIFKLSGKRGDKIYLCRQTEKKENITTNNIKGCKPIYIADQYHILMLKPGSYFFFSPPPNRPIFSNNNIETQQKYLTVLEAKAGEILYVGDILYRQAIKQIKDYDDEEVTVLNSQFKVLDKFELLQNLLEKNSTQIHKSFINQPWEANYLIKHYSDLQKYFKKKLLKNV